MLKKNIFFISITLILVVFAGYLIYDNSAKSDIINQQTLELQNAYNQINKITGQLSNSVDYSKQLNSIIKQKESDIANLSTEVKDKENIIINANERIDKLKEEKQQQEQELNQLITSLQTVEDNKVIQEMYHNTFVLYQNEVVYARMSPLFAQIADDPEDYSKLGIPFFYFKDENPLTDEEKQILGAYYSLYDYIIIYNATEDVHVIYHEIGHIIYKNYFLNNQNNLDIWKYDYQLLKDNNALSSEYAYTDELEGFSEEYAAYKTNSNPNQPAEIKQTIFEPIDNFLRS